MAYFHTTVLDNQIKALPTVDTASGSIATFDTDMTENLVKCVCEIPDTGASAVNVTRCGVNLLNPALRVNGYYISATGVITPESNSCYIYIKVNVGETYTFSGRAYGTGNKRVHAYDENKNWIEQLGYKSMSGTGDYSVTVTIPNGCQYVGLSFAQADGNRLFTTGDEVLPYVAYNGNTYTVNFGSTVLGGAVDVITGKIIDGSDVVSYAQNTVEIPTLNGINNVFANTGDTEVKYLLSVGKKIA